jgi:hypothetical protein
MHKGRRCPRFLQHWLTITGNKTSFAPRRLNLGLFLFNGGSPIFYTPGDFTDEGIVDEPALTITWTGFMSVLHPNDTTYQMQLGFDPDRGANVINVGAITPAGDLLVVCEVDYFWEGWNDTASANITRWVGAGVEHTDGGTLTSVAKPWF